MVLDYWLVATVAGLIALVYLMYKDAIRPGYSKECIDEKASWKKGKAGR